MTHSNHLWLDPAPEVEWEVWSEDTFDREARPTRDTRGKGLLDGLKALWIRFLLETVRPKGRQSFTRFYLRRPPAAAVRIQGPWDGAVSLRSWIFGMKTRAYRGRLDVADRQLLEAIIHIHAQLLRQERSSEPILTMAAEAADRREFTTSLEEMAKPWGVILDQATLEKARSLNPLAEFEDGKVREGPKSPAPRVKRNRKRRSLPASGKTSPRFVDYRLVGAVVFLIAGLFFLVIFGRSYSLNCTRIESNQVDCIRHSSWLGLITFSRKSVDGLWRARVGQICDSNGCVAFPELDTAEGSVKLHDGSSGDSAPETRIVEQINTYLGDPGAQKLEIVIDISVSQLLVPAALILGGVVAFSMWVINLLHNRKRRLTNYT